MGVKLKSHTLREEHRLGVFENVVLRRIFGPKRDKVTSGCRNLHYLYSSPSIIRMIKQRMMAWEGHVARMGGRGMCTCYWWERQKERGQLERKDGAIVCSDLSQVREQWRALVTTVMSFPVP
jgi:hypothetical protein